MRLKVNDNPFIGLQADIQVKRYRCLNRRNFQNDYEGPAEDALSGKEHPDVMYHVFRKLAPDVSVANYRVPIASRNLSLVPSSSC